MYLREYYWKMSKMFVAKSKIAQQIFLEPKIFK